MKMNWLKGIKVSNSKGVMSYMLRNRLLRLQEMPSSINLLRKKPEEELSMSNLRTSEMSCKFKNRKKEPELLSVVNKKSA
jgi:hypothetical protein